MADGLFARFAAELAGVRARWPHGPPPDQDFAQYVAKRTTESPPIADLYLAWWCSSGDAAAVAAFEAAYEHDLRVAASRFRDVPADELRQMLRIKLFVGTPSSPPKIRDYAGRGSLQSWLRVTAVRSFLDIVRATRVQRYTQELDETELLGVSDPQGRSISSELAGVVKRAFADAVAKLAPRQRVFLRHAYVDRHTLDRIAANYSVHRATVARTLAAARERLIADTRAGVIAMIGIDSDELDSVIRALDSRVELSLSRVLALDSGVSARSTAER